MSNTITTNAVASGLRSITDADEKETSTSSLGKNEFLKILAAQMAYQDPLEPASNTEFIAQLAQFSALEQMQNISATMTASLANSMVGKYVEVSPNGAGGQTYYGRVDGMATENGTQYLLVNGEFFSVDSVTAVLDVDDTQDGILGQVALIGKTVTATVLGEDDTERTVEGQVEGLVAENGVVYAMVNGEKVATTAITQIMDQSQQTQVNSQYHAEY